MYATQLAVNEVADRSSFKIVAAVDFPASTNKTPCVGLIHPFATGKLFNKIDWNKGAYDTVRLDNVATVPMYSLVFARRGRAAARSGQHNYNASLAREVFAIAEACPPLLSGDHSPVLT